MSWSLLLLVRIALGDLYAGWHGSALGETRGWFLGWGGPCCRVAGAADKQEELQAESHLGGSTQLGVQKFKKQERHFLIQVYNEF